MSEPLDPIEEPTAEQRTAVDALLARAGDDGTVWLDPPGDLADRVVEAVAAAAATDDGPDVVRDSTGVPWWLAAAAAIVVVAAGLALIGRGGDDSTVFALSGTDAAPDASAELVVSATPAGLKLLLDADGLPGAPEGTYYEAWVSDGTVRVSAGTFHLRNGSNRIELWAGVVGPEFDQFAITLEPVDDDNGSSGMAYLSGTFSLDG